MSCSLSDFLLPGNRGRSIGPASLRCIHRNDCPYSRDRVFENSLHQRPSRVRPWLTSWQKKQNAFLQKFPVPIMLVISYVPTKLWNTHCLICYTQSLPQWNVFLL